MSDITTTISKLEAHFEAWHNKKYKDLHKTTTEYIDDQIATLTSENQDSTAIINNQIKEIGSYLCELIDGVQYGGNINDIGNTLANKNYDLRYGNLTNIVNTVTANREDINDIKGKYVTADYINSAISANGMKTIAITSNKSLNSYTTFGFYKSISTEVTNTISEKPANIQEPFILIIIDASDNNSDNNIKQILSTINTNRTFTRSRINGNWGNWAELYDTNNTATLDMTVEFEDTTKQPQTYTLLKK